MKVVLMFCIGKSFCFFMAFDNRVNEITLMILLVD